MRQEEIAALPALVRKYLDYISGIKSKSQLTVLEYASDLRLFFRFIAKRRGLCGKDVPFNEIDVSLMSDKDICSVSLDDAYAFLGYCRNERKNDNNARARKVVSIKRFYRYLEANGKIKKNTVAFLESPKTKKALPKYLTLEQSAALLNAADGKFEKRDYCMTTLFLNCGLRLSELVGINLSDIKDDGSLKVLGKGDKERVVYLNEACRNAIADYLAVRPADGVKDRDALFISCRKRRISRQGVQKIVEKLLTKIGLGGRGYSVHKLRHTAATLMYQYGGVDPLELKKILGHENLSTTEIYTHVRDEQLKKALDSNPLNDPSNLKKS